MPPKIHLGQSDFLSLRQEKGYYIDKSAFISAVLRAGALVQLYPRPRRFGKTLNLSTLRYFLEKGKDRTDFFSDLEVWQDPDARPHFQRYPVIFLSFRDVNQPTWEGAKERISKLIRDLLVYHTEALESPKVSMEARADLQTIKSGTGNLHGVLEYLSAALHQHYGEKVVILIDEYDAPILSGYEHGYYAEAAAFFRSFFTSGLKDNPHLFRGVLTGILRVAKESMFSGLNNLAVYSLLHNRPIEPFGFNQSEVDTALSLFGRADETAAIQTWYNGYHFGRQTVYNPWSFLNFLDNPDQHPAPYWLNTSDNALVRSLLLQRTDLDADFQALLEGRGVEQEIDENVSLRDMQPNNLWSLLLFSGYLTTESVRYEEGQPHATLRIPNLEVRILWRRSFSDWLANVAGNPTPLQQAILNGDAERTEGLLSDLLRRHVSSHDVTETQDEAFYHAFVLGMLVTMERTHRVRSNRESGLGRADLLLIPKEPGRPGVILEFKRQKGRKSLKTLALEALNQIQRLDYRRELEEAGATPIRYLGVAFAGKAVVVRG